MDEPDNVIRIGDDWLILKQMFECKEWYKKWVKAGKPDDGMNAPTEAALRSSAPP